MGQTSSGNSNIYGTQVSLKASDTVDKFKETLAGSWGLNTKSFPNLNCVYCGSLCFVSSCGRIDLSNIPTIYLKLPSASKPWKLTVGSEVYYISAGQIEVGLKTQSEPVWIEGILIL